MLYALCGFANFSSVGILLSGLSAMVPERRMDLISISGKAYGLLYWLPSLTDLWLYTLEVPMSFSKMFSTYRNIFFLSTNLYLTAI